MTLWILKTAMQQFLERHLLQSNLDEIYPKYGYCNDILVKLNVFNLRVKDVPIPARYGNRKIQDKIWAIYRESLLVAPR